jgi:hypothetical protein
MVLPCCADSNSQTHILNTRQRKNTSQDLPPNSMHGYWERSRVPAGTNGFGVAMSQRWPQSVPIQMRQDRRCRILSGSTAPRLSVLHADCLHKTSLSADDWVPKKMILKPLAPVYQHAYQHDTRRLTSTYYEYASSRSSDDTSDGLCNGMGSRTSTCATVQQFAPMVHSEHDGDEEMAEFLDNSPDAGGRVRLSDAKGGVVRGMQGARLCDTGSAPPARASENDNRRALQRAMCEGDCSMASCTTCACNRSASAPLPEGPGSHGALALPLTESGCGDCDEEIWASRFWVCFSQ